MDKLKLLKSVVLRTKSFKALILGALIIGCIITQFPNDEKKVKLENFNFETSSFSTVPNEKHETNEVLIVNDHSSEKIESIVEDNSGEVPMKILQDSNLNNGIHSVVEEGVKIMDMFADTDSEQYQAFKSMLTLWNPESSKWAVQASKRYKKALVLRDSRPSDWYDEPEKGDRRIKRIVDIEQCDCKREILAHTMVTYEGGDHGNSSISTCSQHSFHRGAKQKIVSFSFYGNPDSQQGKERKYFQGIKDNLKEMPIFYPDWTLRLYYDLEDQHPLMKELCDLACNDPNIDLCHVKNIPVLGDVSKVFAMNWRFLPMLDPQVSHMVSRDLDSLINDREAAAVKEWLDSDKAFHFMRDHPAHSIEVLGSGWGVRMSQLERSFIDAGFMTAVKDPIFWAPRGAYGPDQGFLKRYLWPWGKWSALSHDAYTCLQFPRTSPFPTQRKLSTNNFVASVVSSNDILQKECPVKCRPKNHKDWKYC